MKGVNSEEFKKNINEKVCLLLKLFKKYAKKFNELLPLCELSLTTKTAISTEVLNELKETVKQYSNAINNEKLIKIFNLQDETTNIKEDKIDFSELEPQSMNVLDKYELEIKKLQKENENLTQKILLFDKKEKDESSLLKAKLQKIQIEKNELEETISELQKKNKELALKNDTLKENQKNLKKQEEIIEQLNKQIETLEIDLKYKDKTISYMESLLQKINIQPNGENIIKNSISKVSNNSFSTQKKFDNSNRYEVNDNENYNCNYKSNDVYNNPNYESKVISGSKLIFEHEQKEKEELENDYQEKENKNNINDIPEDEEGNEEGLFQSQEINTKNNKETTQSGTLQNEIDVLDKEIISLKSKLKMMIDKK